MWEEEVEFQSRQLILGGRYPFLFSKSILKLIFEGMAKLLSQILLLQAEIEREEKEIEQLSLKVDLSLLMILELATLISNLKTEISSKNNQKDE